MSCGTVAPLRFAFLTLVLCGCYSVKPLPAGATLAAPHAFDGTTPGDARTIGGVEFRWAPAGTFVMGSPPSEVERRPGEDQAEVMISKGFWAGRFEVTQSEWLRIAGAAPESFNVGESDRHPMYRIDWAQAGNFCERLTELAHASGELPMDWRIRLPTEAQWEYAARAGTTTATVFGNSLSSTQANFRGAPYNGAAVGPSLDVTVPVGSYEANAWGLFDVHGNVYEWTRDWYHAALPGGVDPDLEDAIGTANEAGSYSRVRKGGCYADEGMFLRSGFRLRFEPERRHEHIGFRVIAERSS